MAIDPRGSNSGIPLLISDLGEVIRISGEGVIWGGNRGGRGGNRNIWPKFHIDLSPASGRVRSSSLSMI